MSASCSLQVRAPYARPAQVGRASAREPAGAGRARGSGRCAWPPGTRRARCGPSSRPTPDLPKPPHSACGTYGWKSLIHTVPWRSRPATRRARPASLVHTPPASPYSVSLASATASSSVRKRLDGEDRPKISSRTTRIARWQSSKTVGRVEEAVAGRTSEGSGRSPPLRSTAPSSSGATRRTPRPSPAAAAETSGPHSTPSSVPRPSRMRWARAASSATKRSWTDSSMIRREPAEQTWPLWMKAAFSAWSTAVSKPLGGAGVGEDDVGVLAAQLQRDLLHAGRGGLHDLRAGGQAAGEGDQVDVGVLGQPGADGVARAGDEVGHAGRSPASASSFTRSTVDSGVISLGLRTKVLPAAERRGDLPAGLEQRVVPGRDHARRRRRARGRRRCGRRRPASTTRPPASFPTRSAK